MAIRDNPLAAKSMGIDTALYKSLTFGVSGLYTGIAGALGAIVIQFVAPDSFNFFLAVSFLVGLVVGGVGWVPGAIIGGAFTLFVPNIADELAKNLGSNFKGLAWAIYGLILILIIYVMPAGAGGFIRLVTQRLMRRT
jgi:branched-chain amino acid transport system permease protein